MSKQQTSLHDQTEGKVTVELPDGQPYTVNEDWMEEAPDKPAPID